MPLWVRRTLIAVPILMASLDVIENGCIAVVFVDVAAFVERRRRNLQSRYSGEDHSWGAN